MATLLLDRAQLEVKSEGDALAIYEAGQRRSTVPVALIDQCIIHGSQTRLDSGVLLKLAMAGATTVMFSPRQPSHRVVVLGPLHNDAAVRLAQAGRALDDAFCRAWATALVLAKLHRQCRTLRLMRQVRADARKPLLHAEQCVAAIAAGLGKGEPATATPGTNLDQLRGLEGSAARAYFSGMAAVMPPALEFSGRNRRPPRDPVNACLSLAYTLLHSQATRACIVAGLDPLLGFYHRPAFGRESLASDLIEPLRPAVDKWIWDMLRARMLREDHFATDKTACLLGKAGRGIFYSEWSSSSAPWRRRLLQHARSLAHSLRETGAPWLTDTNQDDECP